MRTWCCLLLCWLGLGTACRQPPRLPQAACVLSAQRDHGLGDLRQHGWPTAATPAERARRQHLAETLLPCLASPDPHLRDELTFTALQAWMRAAELDPPTLRVLMAELLAWLQWPSHDARVLAGFAQPFAALVLAEIARVDRMQPYLQADERERLITHAAHYLRHVHDYRGFDAIDGWRHGVAHGADVAMQLMLLPTTTSAQAHVVLDAVAAQVLPTNHAYRFGEPTRLARAVLVWAARGQWNESEWRAWFSSLLPRRPNGSAHAAAAITEATLIDQHNRTAFLLALYVRVAEAPAEGAWRAPLLVVVREALQAEE